MWHQVARLCLRRLALFVAVSIASALAIGAAPGDPLADLALSGQASREGLAAIRAARGISDQPAARARATLGRLLRLELGDSTLHQRPVASLVAPRLRHSLALTAAALAIAWAVASLAVAWQLAPRARLATTPVAVAMAALQAIPDVVVALLVLAGMAAGGLVWGSAGDVTWAGMIAGSVVLAVVHLPTAWRHLWTTLNGRLGEPWMQGLRARGLSHRHLVWRHAVRASAAPLLAVGAVGFASLLSAALVVETLFGIPGLGALMLDAMLARDVPLALGGVMATAAVTLVVLTVADVIALRADPRTRALEATA